MGSGRSALGLVVVLLAFSGAVLGAGVSRANVSTCGSLSRETGPPVGHGGGGGSELSDTGFVSAGDSWAVGSFIDSTLHAHQTLIERFDRSGWAVIHSPNQSGMNNGLNGVSMTPGGGWAAGYALEGPSSGPKYQPLALRWDGTRWSLASPANFTSDSLFTGVDALVLQPDFVTWPDSGGRRGTATV